MVFQSYALYPHLTVAENMAFPLKQKRVPAAERNQRVLEAARLLELEPYLDRRPRQLSGGQRQRVAMGRAIVRQPQAFLMDEPLSNLDAKLRVQTRAEIAALQQRLGVTTIYVTHDQVEAMTLGHRVAVLKDGRLQQCDTPRNLYEHPCNVFVRRVRGITRDEPRPSPLRRHRCAHRGHADPTAGSGCSRRPPWRTLRSRRWPSAGLADRRDRGRRAIREFPQWKAEPELPGPSGGGHRLRRLDPLRRCRWAVGRTADRPRRRPSSSRRGRPGQGRRSRPPTRTCLIPQAEIASVTDALIPRNGSPVVVAIDIGGSWIKGALVGADARPMAGQRVATPDASEF